MTEVQWHLSPHVTVRLSNGLGLTPLAPDWAPEVGVLFISPGGDQDGLDMSQSTVIFIFFSSLLRSTASAVPA